MRGAAMMVAALVGPLAAGALPQCHMGVVRTPARAESTLSVARAFSWRPHSVLTRRACLPPPLMPVPVTPSADLAQRERDAADGHRPVPGGVRRDRTEQQPAPDAGSQLHRESRGEACLDITLKLPQLASPLQPLARCAENRSFNSLSNSRVRYLLARAPPSRPPLFGGGSASRPEGCTWG